MAQRNAFLILKVAIHTVVIKHHSLKWLTGAAETRMFIAEVTGSLFMALSLDMKEQHVNFNKLHENSNSPFLINTPGC
jgi:hypothetical protein